MGEQDKATAVFEVLDSTLADMAPDLLGLWVTQAPTRDVAFGVGLDDGDSASDGQVPVWRSRFPADLKQADSLLTRYEEQIKDSQAILDRMPEQISRLIQHPDADGADDLSFALPATEQPLTDAQQEFLNTIQALKGMEPPTAQELQEINQPQSFGLDFGGSEEGLGGWKQAAERLQAFISRVLSVIANYAWVETQIEGKTIARTTVGWTGDMNSVWLNGISIEHQQLHQRSLALTLASRHTLLEQVTMAVKLALKVSLSLSLPGGAIAVLPVVWKFINQVIRKQGRD